MENLQYAEELVREYLVFRGFTNTLQSFQMELSTDIGKAFQVDKILDLIFSVYVPNFQAEKLVDLLGFFKQYLSSLTNIDSALSSTFSKLEVSVLRYYIVYALKAKRPDKVAEFFGVNGNELLQKPHDWTPWFAIPYIKNPQLDPDFRVFFSKEWFDALHLLLRNFFSEVFNGTHIPALLKISSDKNTVNSLKREIKQLNVKLSQYQALLEERELELCQLKRCSSVLQNENLDQSKAVLDVCSHASPVLDETESTQPPSVSGRGRSENEVSFASHIDDSTSSYPMRDSSFTQLGQDVVCNESADDDVAEEFLDVKIQFQETFLGHTSPISCCRFSASGNNIASASVDGTVRIWTYESSTPASRNATIYCGAEVMSLDWDCKSDRLLLIGTSDGCIKAWNADAKRVVCDLNTSEAFPSILDLKCSPVEPIFVSAAASRSHDSSYLDMFASLTVWNMKMWKAMTVLPLGEDPPAITSLCFNHNGKILAASASDGMIHMFDMSAGLQITGWPAHDSSISSILFGPEETSIFSLGSDGKIFEWSLHNQGQILWSRNSTGFNDPKSSKYCRHEMALDATGKKLLVTSNSSRSPIYEVRGQTRGWRTLPHSARVTTVDWHPTAPIFLTGSADNSVRVTSIS